MSVSGRTMKALSVAGIVILGPVAAVLVLGDIPAAFGIEWFCLWEGPATNAADLYAASGAITIAATWIALVVGTIAAHKRGRPNLGTALPPVWFALIVASSIVVASAIGSQPCQGESPFVPF